jgi:hypothetical protein
VQNLSPRAARLYLTRLDDLWASLFRASLPPASGLTASSCSYGRGFAFRFFQLHLAATPCGFATVAVIGPDWLLSSNEILPMLGTPRTGGAGAGTYLAFEMRNPAFDANGNCTANFVVLKRVSGVVTALSSFAAGCRNNMSMRFIARGDLILGYVDGWQVVALSGIGVPAGQPGIGGYATPSGNAINLVQVGPVDAIAPSAVNPSSLGVAAFPNRIEMQWQGVADDPRGVGLWTYVLYRNGAYLGMAAQPNYVDEAVAPSTTYTYQIWAVDQHYGWSSALSANLTAAPAGTTEPRRIGVRPEGAYWGAAGEQIDLRSGNLNYTVPLVKALARSGWSATFALSYNSQMWRQDSGGTWKLGRDVGYGLGWRLMAGSITPVYQGTWAIHHYVFTDSTGAEYRLDVNNGNVWTSREGFYGSFDANTWYLYFPDGTKWAMWVQSGGNEDDAGTLYPKQMWDTNGNWIELRGRLRRRGRRHERAHPVHHGHPQRVQRAVHLPVQRRLESPPGAHHRRGDRLHVYLPRQSIRDVSVQWRRLRNRQLPPSRHSDRLERLHRVSVQPVERRDDADDDPAGRQHPLGIPHLHLLGRAELPRDSVAANDAFGRGRALELDDRSRQPHQPPCGRDGRRRRRGDAESLDVRDVRRRAGAHCHV